MDSLFSTVKKFDPITGSGKWDDDFVDRFNHWWTAIVLIISAVVVSAKQYVGAPIDCWMPKQFSKAWKQYAESYCWIQNTYFVPKDVELPRQHTYRVESQLSYYQWVPYVLALQACLFYLPHAIWRLLNWQSGVNVQCLVNLACDANNADPDNRPNSISTISRYLEKTVTMFQESKYSIAIRIKRCLFCMCGSRHLGNYLVSLYLLVKLLFLANVIGQFFLLNSFLGTNYTFYGWNILRDLVRGHEWSESGHFPRVTMCDFQIRSLGQRHNYTVQCVLMINLFNEKIYIFLWFWFFLVAVVSAGSLLYWMFRILLLGQRTSFVKRFLKITKSYNPGRHGPAFKDFISKSLKTDGVFMLRLIYLNAGEIVTTDLATDLWKRFKITRPELSDEIDGEPPNEKEQFM